MDGLLAVAAVQFLACGSFSWVAWRVRGPGAHGAFMAWWASMALLVGMRGVVDVWVAWGTLPLPAAIAWRVAEIAAATAAAWGITTYIAYIYSGRRSVAVAAGVYFTLLGAAYVAAVLAAKPSEVAVSGASVLVLPPAVGLQVILMLYGVPMLAATAAYLALLPRLESRRQRYRVALVASAILAWVGVGLVANVTRHDFWAPFSVTVLGFFAAVAVVMAFRPPASLVPWLEAGPGEDERRRRQAYEARRERVRQLV